jgi:hypothetical protein
MWFLVINLKGKNWGKNQRILLVTWILHPSPQFGSVILHEVPQCTQKISVLYWPTSKNAKKKYFYASNWIFFFVGIFFYSLWHVKSNFSKPIWTLVFCVHCGTSRKIIDPTDKNCGNGRNICFTSKICSVLPQFYLSNQWQKKHVNIGFFGLNCFKPSSHEVISFEENMYIFRVGVSSWAIPAI